MLYLKPNRRFMIPDRSRSILHFRHLVRRRRSGLWQRKLRPSGSGRLQQPVHAEEADLRTSSHHQKGFVLQGIGRPHVSVHLRRGSVQLGRRRLWQTGTRQQLHTEIPQTHTGTPAGKGTVHRTLQKSIWTFFIFIISSYCYLLAGHMT